MCALKRGRGLENHSIGSDAEILRTESGDHRGASAGPWGAGGVVFPSFISLIPLDTHTHARAHAHTYALQHGPSGKQRRTATSARTLADGQIVPRPVVTTERNQVVQVGVTELEAFVTGDD